MSPLLVLLVALGASGIGIALFLAMGKGVEQSLSEDEGPKPWSMLLFAWVLVSLLAWLSGWGQ